MRWHGPALRSCTWQKPVDRPTIEELLMSKPELGTKHTCEACAERFYDLNRSPAICFKCGAQQSPPKPRMYRPIRAGSDRGAFSRRPLPIPAEKLEPADDLALQEPPHAQTPNHQDSHPLHPPHAQIALHIVPQPAK